MNFTHVKEITGTKYNLAPRKQFCGAKSGSDYSAIVKKHDDVFMKNYETEKFDPTNDGKGSLPNSKETYKVGRDYQF